MRSRVLALLGPFAFAGVLFAGTTGQTALHMPQGTAAGTANGDYVSDSGGTALNTDYQYWIEVPPGLGRLQVEIFDADIGRGTNEDDANRDRDRGGGFSSQVDYTLIRPDGTTAASLLNCDFNTCNDNVWTVLLNSTTAANTAAGHWELVVSMHNGGNDINAFGLRASDGTTGAGGTELNVYSDSMVSMGVNPDPGDNSNTYTLHPWITSGCTCSQNDFDRDSNNTDNIGSVTYTRPSGGSQTISDNALSVDNTWNHDNLTSWVTNDTVDDFGVWTLSSTINTYDNGAINGNYETYYCGSYLTTTDPTSNPIVSGGNPAAFRLYLPTDGGGVPVKPSMAQYLAFRGIGNNPPTVGTMSLFTVTVRITNPTPHDITFSATNLVTANVPGGQVTYGGNPGRSQGGVPVGPAVGAFGNVTWNPGIVAAGTTAAFWYDVRVLLTAIPPGNRLAVTGTPASTNGTRARFVDETGNATQPRATYTMGGICELAIATNAATPVLMSSFDLDVRGGATQIDFSTASEASTIGYYVYRADGTRVNEYLIPATFKAEGGRYHLLDPQNSDPNAQYTIEEVTSGGGTRRYGPYTHLVGLDRDGLRQKNARFHATSQGFGVASESTFDVGANATSASAGAMVGVSQNGIVRVPASTLASATGATVQTVRSFLTSGKISVTDGYSPVYWTTDGDSLLFYGQKGITQYSNERMYRVQQSTNGGVMQALNLSSAAAAVSTFTATETFAQDNFPATVLPIDANGEYWFWDYVLSGDPSFGRRTFTLHVPSLASASGAALTVRLQGAFQGGNHRARITVNGVPIGELTFQSLNAGQSTFNIPGSVLRAGANDVGVEGVLAPGADMDIFYIDTFALKYQKYARPENGAVEMRTSGAVGAGPFTSAPMILDISNPLRPTVVKGARFVSGLAQVTVPGTRTLFMADTFVAPSSVRPFYAARLSGKLRADWVAIAPHNMVAATNSLANLRQREGLNTLVADLDDVYNEFGNGNATPLAIRDFIKSTRSWKPAPRYIVLVGIGNVDYRSLTVPAGPMPPLMMTTQDGIFASDSLFADFNNDRLPDLAIGRIPVSTAAEMSAYVTKLDVNARRSVKNAPILFTADNNDGGLGLDFRAASETAAQPFADRPLTHVSLDQLGGTGARTAIFNAWHAGTPLVSWIGHGGVDLLSNGAVLTSYDSPDLTSTGRLPIFVGMTCTINRFETGIIDALGAAFTRESNGGALAVWSASGLSQHAEAAMIQRTFMDLAEHAPNGTRLGDLMVPALGSHPSDTSSIYLLLGDPAIKLDLPTEVTHGGTPSRGRE